ncbi:MULTISPECIES: hypothetical protein [unclassified Pseudomonas]|uniref:hypothetical protein n=1 Tax=unclassified Pseudomonas TaxID=196821 RepID=UPI0025D4F636|nr:MULTISPECIES: hypothetical protein [unclassified Pseudomonas]
MATEIEETRQQALISLLKTASEQGIDVTELVRATERQISKNIDEPHGFQIIKQIRVAHAYAAGKTTARPASDWSA